ncbi:MAG: Hsp70 family protein [Parachlamydiales bacterium]|nr:Hsp70 family protein [Parachlamydiales bacterium]
MSYVIGIDLGTTHCALTYAIIADKQVELLEIEQVVSGGHVEKKTLLPSFVYFPLEEELKAKIASLPWNENQSFCIGHLAKERGKELPNRLIHSAKSWLCYDGIDRREKVLPQDDSADVKMSPLQVTQEILIHLKEAWNAQMKEFSFSDQKILITVPASFDPAAKELVLEAAANAKYPSVVLLEEPQAAFYSWLNRHESTWRKDIGVGDTILVVDIGGGTTDFTLIGADEEGGELNLKRIAVGDHLLLGGDNLDLALAHLAKDQLENDGHSIDDWQMHHLTHGCREAKEILLGLNPPQSISLSVPGRGSKLIGGSLSTNLQLKDVEEFIVEGFFPFVDFSEEVELDTHGIQQIGLPYAADPRVTAQLASFLRKSNCMPAKVLFNGGSLKAAALTKRLLEQLEQWAKQQQKPVTNVLEGADFDYAVSRGAAYYGLVREGKGIRIKAGTSHSYYIGVQSARPAIPGFPTPLKAICIAPYGMEEGTEVTLEGQEFSLILGQPVTFRFFGRATEKLSDGQTAEVGTVISKWAQELKELHPLESQLDKKEGEGRAVKVKLKAKVTETGVLELWCLSNDNREWKLEFNLRQVEELATV